MRIYYSKVWQVLQINAVVTKWDVTRYDQIGGLIEGLKTAKFIFSNEEMGNIKTIVKSLKYEGISLQVDIRAIENEAKKQRIKQMIYLDGSSFYHILKEI